MSLPDDEALDFDFDELELDETSEAAQAPEDQEGSEGGEAGSQDQLAEGGQEPNLSRRERRLQSLANKARDSERRATEAEARNQLMQQQFELLRQQQTQPQIDPRAEQEYLATLDPAERITYQFNRQLAYVQQSNQQQQVMMLDMMDRNTYQTKASVNPVYKKFEVDVEKMRAAEASRGRYFNREDILAFIVGQKLLQGKDSNKAKPKVTKKAAQTTRPGNTATDVASGRSRDSERSARAKRLATYTF